MRVAGTGHRPEQCRDEATMRHKISEALGSIEVEAVYSGMAAGFDLWFADEAIKMNIPVIACKPWAGHTATVDDQDLYNRIIENAVEVVNVVDSQEYPGPYSYHRRNHYMVNHSTHVLAYLSPDTKSGGTYQCVKYAKSKGKPVRNIYG